MVSWPRNITMYLIRSDIIKLMQSDPDKYDAMSQEIMAAYREGRVI